MLFDERGAEIKIFASYPLDIHFNNIEKLKIVEFIDQWKLLKYQVSLKTMVDPVDWTNLIEILDIYTNSNRPNQSNERYTMRVHGIHGVGMLVANRWIEKVLDVKLVSERLMVVRVIVGRSVLNLVSVYAPQTGWSKVVKEEFLAMLMEVVSG